MTKLRCTVAGVLSGALAFLLILAADKARAQAACGPADQMIAAISGPKYREAALFEALVKTPAGAQADQDVRRPGDRHLDAHHPHGKRHGLSRRHRSGLQAPAPAGK